MLDYLKNIKSLEFCGLTFRDSIFEGDIYKLFAEFVRDATHIKVMAISQFNQRYPEVKPDIQNEFASIINDRTTPLHELRVRRSNKTLLAAIVNAFMNYSGSN